MTFRIAVGGIHTECSTSSPVLMQPEDFRVLRGPDDPEDFSNPLRLLAQGIAFTDPVTGEHRRFGSKRVLAWPA